MKDLFVIDLKDYQPSGKVFSRPSVRAIVVHEEKALLMYSQKYDYYKFPGGGIEAGESHVQALCREVAEESGYQIVEESIEEYGRVYRRQKDTFDENSIFEQENFYYFCEVEEQLCEMNLDDYEEEEGFVPVWMNLLQASRHNLYERQIGGADETMIEREARVFDMADLAVRKRYRNIREEKQIRLLGDLDYAGMLSFVEKQLESRPSEVPGGAKALVSYSRYDHTKRVLAWAKRLYDGYEEKDKINYEDLMIATIFHDVGRSVADLTKEPHAKAGVPMTREYLINHGFEEKRVDYICDLVASHSDKYRMQDAWIDQNLLLLMEADTLDDLGAVGVVWDCMITESRNPKATFEECLDHIMRFTHRVMQDNPMVTPTGKRIWEEKRKLVETFTTSLREDIEFEIEVG